jgi:hypothetical protein
VKNVLKYHLLFFQKYEWGEGQTRGKNHTNTVFLTAFTILGQFNIFHYIVRSKHDWANSSSLQVVVELDKVKLLAS